MASRSTTTIICSINSVTYQRPPSLNSLPPIKRQHQRRADSTLSHICRSWQEATSESGQTYFWNTLTRETSWDRPLPTEQIAQPSEDLGPVPYAGEAASSFTSNEDMLQQLGAALEGDPSGMMFAEAARSLRSAGVFEDAYFDFLTDTIDSGRNESTRTLAEKLRARLCNPLLRQAAPYE